jgi:hypothetical protein
MGLGTWWWDDSVLRAQHGRSNEFAVLYRRCELEGIKE